MSLYTASVGDSTSALASRLDQLIDGEVLVPDAGAVAALTVYGGPPRRPALIIRPRTAVDVARALPVLVESGLPVTTRAGGHSFGRRSVVDRGVVIDVSGLNSVEIDPHSRVAAAGGGTTAGRYGEAVAAHGFVTGFGDTASVGIGGLTLGGGIGFLSRRVGLAADQLVGVELATADGNLRSVDAESDHDLLWALRGGGPGLGVVTQLRYRLTEIREVHGGVLLFEPDAHLLGALVDAIADGPDELSAMVNVLAAPPAPFVPERLRGRPVLAVIGAHSGSPRDAAVAWDVLRALGPVVADTVAAVPYGSLLRDEQTGDASAVTGAGFADRMDAARAERAIAALDDLRAPVAVVNIRPMGGAIARVPVGATAFAHRDRRAMVVVSTIFPDPAAAETARPIVDTLVTDLSDGDAGYVNFLGDVPDLERRAFPPATLERLQRIRATVDPTGMFSRA
jgi:FAD/FMN-containing dehydrogenase